MFNFIKKGVNANGGPEKDDEKEKRKREKKMRKESKQAGLSSSMSTEELLRLDEVSWLHRTGEGGSEEYE